MWWRKKFEYIFTYTSGEHSCARLSDYGHGRGLLLLIAYLKCFFDQVARDRMSKGFVYVLACSFGIGGIKHQEVRDETAHTLVIQFVEHGQQSLPD